MEISVPFGQTLSYFDLMAHHQEYFYHQPREVRNWPWHERLAEAMPIRHETLQRFTYLFETRQVQIERSIITPGDVCSLPNIVELTAWWIAYTEICDSHHGMRGLMTPSSTMFGEHVLCMYFMVNDMLATRLNVR